MIIIGCLLLEEAARPKTGLLVRDVVVSYPWHVQKKKMELGTAGGSLRPLVGPPQLVPYPAVMAPIRA
jgi:hypothetical protein